MTALVLKRLRKEWQGPAITIVVGTAREQVGVGESQAVVTFKKPSLLWQMVMRPSLAFGEAYMKGDITVEGDLLAVLQGFYQSYTSFMPRLFLWVGQVWSQRPASITQSVRNAQHHYDIGNDFYRLWLDPSLTYSCAYFPTGNETLEQAQEYKRDLLCRKLRLEPGQTLLDIGCGWGGLVFHAVEKYGVSATGITPAHEQAVYVREEAQRRGLADKIKVIEGDWRTIHHESVDRLVSVGMFEHVGQAHYTEFLHRWGELLKDSGISLLHTIGHRVPTVPDPWIRKYIFPGGYLPALEEIAIPAAAAGLRLYRAENLRPHYALTLAAWAENFSAVREKVVALLGEEFARMWWLYLQASEASFRWGSLELWQVELYGPEVSLPLNRELYEPQTVIARH